MNEPISEAYLSSFFEDSLIGVPYQDALEHLNDCMRIVDIYLLCALLVRQAVRENPEQPLRVQGLRAEPEDVRSALCADRPQAGENRLSASLCAALRRGWMIVGTRSSLSHALPFTALAKRLKLSRFEQFCLYLSLGRFFDRKYEDVFGILEEGQGAQPPSIGLAYGLFCMADSALPTDCAAFFEKCGFLLRRDNARTGGMTEPVLLRENAFLALSQAAYGQFSTGLEGSLFTPAHAETLPAMLSGTERLDALCDAMAALERTGADRGIFHLYGEPGSGRLFTVRHFARRTGRALLLLNTPLLFSLDGQALENRLWDIGCAALGGLLPVFLEFDVPQDSPQARLLVQAMGKCGVRCFFLISRTAALPETGRVFRLLRFPVESANQQERAALWEAARPDASQRDDLDSVVLSNKYHLNPGQIEQVMSCARLQTPAGTVTGEREIAKAVALHSSGNLSSQCTRVAPVFTFDDLILTDICKNQIRRVVNRIRYSYQVNVEWGFDKKFAYGRGVSVLLYGLPGTGKTMCAQVLAHELGLELYKADLSALVSKYVGETEKNLSTLFEEARKSNAILFFDEADALFSKRTSDSSSSNDKYANMETSHLLQKMEEFNGITILATNLAGNFDKAFYRRLNYVVSVPFPDEQTRLLLWQKSFPAGCPLGGDVDFALLARRHEISPSTIKSVAVEAAYRAASAGVAVGMRQIIGALSAELSKQGKTLSVQDQLGFEPEA